MSKISIIIPVYNVEKFLPECINSVFSQTLSDIEIICVNDASPDNSSAILEEYARKDNRLKIITHEKNQGLGPARNTGVSHATSPYISFVDSDDFIAPAMMETLYKAITSNNADLAWCGMAKVSESGNLIEPGRIPEGVWSVPQVLECEKLYPSVQVVCNKLFRRELIKDIKQLPILIEDEPTIAQYFTYCKKIITINESLYFYRKTPESLSNPAQHTPKYWQQFFEDYKLYFSILNKKFPDRAILKKQIILRHRSLLWRINTYQLLRTFNWKEQEKTILFYLKEDSLQLKQSNPVMFFYLITLFRCNLNTRIKEELLEIALKLVRISWLKKTSYIRLPYDMIRVEIPKLKNVLYKKLDYLAIIFYKILSGIYNGLSRKAVWLVGERNDTAQENGYYFYKYLKTFQSHEKSYYIIDKQCNEYKNVRDLGNCIQFNSLKHKILFFASKYYVTAHNHYCKPITSFIRNRVNFSSGTKNIFLDHGITYADVSEFYGKKNSGIDLFICGAKPEYDHVKKTFGYPEEEVVYTGFARFDGLHDFNTKRQILLMPTWRREIWKNIKNDDQEYFKRTNYYIQLQRLLNNPELHKLLENYDYRLFFYPHYEIHKYLKLFSTTNMRISIVSKDNCSVQDLLKESALLIVDTSSVSFDFAYMFKPLIYYRFDKNDFLKSHLKPGYFVHETMGFGPVIEKEQELIIALEGYLKNNCELEDKYFKRIKDFYPLYDSDNCHRIYKAIKSI